MFFHWPCRRCSRRGLVTITFMKFLPHSVSHRGTFSKSWWTWWERLSSVFVGSLSVSLYLLMFMFFPLSGCRLWRVSTPQWGSWASVTWSPCCCWFSGSQSWIHQSSSFLQPTGSAASAASTDRPVPHASTLPWSCEHWLASNATNGYTELVPRACWGCWAHWALSPWVPRNSWASCASSGHQSLHKHTHL